MKLFELSPFSHRTRCKSIETLRIKRIISVSERSLHDDACFGTWVNLLIIIRNCNFYMNFFIIDGLLPDFCRN